ncbi:cobalt-zinc-cadmium resistance protein CzcA [Arcticibacter pallidicorallinus]|uniref:Cobalt-zinc-cadmium resistance protein CzcA n=1 Tax=Arcticibacter pallidicorallinus TaxID=1259464 RepID=A0A2T0U3H0_9SPHI|nr:CusA/CzcA family heavy metal efflux RND transporter [Arcticibacter pallidicorallinus]PRY52457.1 cobalt-zinc-cadmium resistance protein CzcA [Arcticibacter pallidicorallinus]
MLDKIILYSVRNKVVVAVGVILLIIWGAYSAFNLPIDAVPDITNNQVQVITQAPDLGAQEVEQFITNPVELALSNIADVEEQRSISRSGISVITIVFNDKTDIYWARQQVSERLKEAESQIPEGMGKPSMGPITTGLGEIYHYVVHTKPGYEKKYTATDLRTIQDWIIKRQLTSTKGLAEVSAWGGHVKQYEVAVDNDRLNAFGVTVTDIYNALQKNNANTGGSYIEQQNNAYFIRGLGQVKTLSDIGKIVISNTKGIPVLVRDVADVQFGSATRYGAVTRNGEGEVVAGITLMLKGENFNEVIRNVRERMVQIQKSLPEGVVIEPFIDRTELVGRAIGTVEKNLIEGGLIVVFILVLLLGNLRAGLVVASVIPLSLLFALGMMRLFGVSGNLMSLGAIDFGLIVDGAVIIVESIVHRISTATFHISGIQKLNQNQMDEEVYTASSRIRNSAAFGEIIILIVYLPLLSLVGIEGKMFRPMAETVSFAILGAFILSLTWVPMASALFLSKKTTHKRNFSDRIMDSLHRIYQPVLNRTLRIKRTVVMLSVAILAVSIWLFSRMGGEFIPTLEEGDLAVEISMMQGTSLTQAIETFGKAEKVLKAEFPEILQAVTRIGSAEIPTDPMPIERGDMMLSMKPKEEWTRASSRAEISELIEEALSVIPGIRVEVTQPMQMRFNELMTGIRQDVAIKVFGDDMEILSENADKIALLIKDVEGVSEPMVEQVSGLPQILVTPNRDMIAQYGLSIEEVNNILQTAFAGKIAGVVFEGDQRFDLVVRLRRELREDIKSIENLYLPLPSGNQIPLSQIAKIEIKDAPAQISHEDSRRRIYVGFNVRGRDVESVVYEIEQKLQNNLKLPSGYYTTYGGQFENLNKAKERLSVAVPAALLLILSLLYFTFRSLKETLLIFTAVPLSAIGGILALALRDMPFSISAGIGFIALFGVAVLNGIVLVGYFNQLKAEGITDIYERVRKGTYVRLRPVILTASVASLGFLPMALSTTAGAEVQKPLATVVIGGLISATLLTLLILPALYILVFEKQEKKMRLNPWPGLPAIFLMLALSMTPVERLFAQDTKSLHQVIEMARESNPSLKASSLAIDQAAALQSTAFELDKTVLTLSQDPTAGGSNDNSLNLSQSFAFPSVYAAQRDVLKGERSLAETGFHLAKLNLIRDVSSAYQQLAYFQKKAALLQSLDSIYRNFDDRASVRYSSGETSYLEKLAAQSRQKEVGMQQRQTESDLLIMQAELKKLTGSREVIVAEDLKALDVDTGRNQSFDANPVILQQQKVIEISGDRIRLEKRKLLPDITLGYSHQLIIHDFNPANISREYFPGTRIAGFQVGLGIPLAIGAQRARIRAADIERRIAQSSLTSLQNNLGSNYTKQAAEVNKQVQALEYYQSSALNEASEMLRISQFAFEKGEIGYVEHLQNLTQAINIRIGYLEALHQFNQATIQLNYLKGTL